MQIFKKAYKPREITYLGFERFFTRKKHLKIKNRLFRQPQYVVSVALAHHNIKHFSV